MNPTKSFTCEVTAFLLPESADLGIAGSFHWASVATAHVFDPKFRGSFGPGDGVIVQEAMRAIQGKAVAKTQEAAMTLAVRGLLEQIEGVADPHGD